MAKFLRASCYFSHVLALLLLLGGSSRVHAQAQTATSYPDPYSHGLGTDSAYENFFVSPAVSTQGSSTKATFNGGVTLGEYWARTLGKGFNASPQFELGIVGPLPSGHPVDGLASFDFMFANKISRRTLYPFLNGGYTRFFVTGNAVNFGLGIDFGKKEESGLVRLEIRDYYLFTGPRQHVIGLRIGFGRLVAD